jgi:hypothetical protein
MQPVYRRSFRTMTFGAYRAFQAWVRSTRAVRNHFFLLMPAANDPYPGQRQPPPPPVEIDGEPEWYADAILDSRMFGRQRELQYLVKWTGYDQPKWEPATLVNGLEVIDRFHERYPDKPGPLPEDPEQLLERSVLRLVGARPYEGDTVTARLEKGLK